MATVGPDKRLSYYRQDAGRVIADLHSHKLGLTNSEAARRRDEHGPNIVPDLRPAATRAVARNLLISPYILVPAIGTLLCLYLHAPTAAILFGAITSAAVLVGWRERRGGNRPFALDELAPSSARVLRNGDIKRIAREEIAIGDIVYLEPGDIVPADLRIVDERGLRVDESLLAGHVSFARKFSYALAAATPLHMRHNLVFMGTTVVAGSAHAVAVATGQHTELGHIALMGRRTDKAAGKHPFQVQRSSIILSLIAAATLLVLVTGGYFGRRIGGRDVIVLAACFCAAIVPNGLPVAVFVRLRQVAHGLRHIGFLTQRPSVVLSLGTANAILARQHDVLTSRIPMASAALIGRTVYHASGSGYSPVGTIMTDRNTPLGARARNDLALFFLASSITADAAVYPPDGIHDDWHVVGDTYAGAIRTLVRRAGFRTEEIAEKYVAVRDFPFDTMRNLSSVIAQHDASTTLFTQGSPEAVMSRCTTLWDHGHTRHFTAADHTFYTNYLLSTHTQPTHYAAIAYRPLPAHTETADVKSEHVERELTFLGIITIEDQLFDNADVALEKAHGNHLAVTVIGNDSRARTAQDLSEISDEQLGHLLAAGGSTFTGLTTEDKLRLAVVAETCGLTPVVIGDGVEDIPAMVHGHTSVALAAAAPVTKTASETLLLGGGLATLVEVIERSRANVADLLHERRDAFMTAVAEMGLITIGVTAQILFGIPPALGAAQILCVTLLAAILPICLPRRYMAASRPVYQVQTMARRTMLGFGILAASISYAAFCLSFTWHALSPSHIDTGSSFYLEAASTAYATLVCCQLINVAFTRTGSSDRSRKTSRENNAALFIVGCSALFGTLNLLYDPPLEHLFATAAIGITGWILVLCGATLYAAARLLQRYTHLHTRGAIIELHRLVHGKNSPIKI